MCLNKLRGSKSFNDFIYTREKLSFTCLLHPPELCELTFTEIDWKYLVTCLFFPNVFFFPNQVLVVISFIHTRTSRLKDKNALLTGYNYFSFTFLCLIKNTEKNSQMEKELWSKSFTLSGLCLNDSYMYCTSVHNHHYYHQIAFVSS